MGVARSVTRALVEPRRTPSGGQDFLRSSRKVAPEYRSLQAPVHRLLTMKASKALDMKDVQSAESKPQNERLRLQSAKKNNQVRQKVKIAPNQKFVPMADVRRAKRGLRGRMIYEDENEAFNVPGIGTGYGKLRPEDVTEAEDYLIIN
ncbi:hypothetical protein F5Y07DRAFT_191386 [Xylaria sp. FL0933]|nr:hypothetical protein F5Y07DRAFT_191386 [Xylaria sp. FL0933]